MKTILIITAIALGGFAFSKVPCSDGICISRQTQETSRLAGLNQNSYHRQTAFTDTTRVTTVKLTVSGIDCSGCADFIHKALSATKGVIGDQVKYPGNIVIVRYNEADISDKKIAAIIDKLGYRAEIEPKNK